MPINLVHSLLHRVDEGWDPISAEYANEYDGFASREIDTALVKKLESLAGGLAGKRILDLGGGPGHYSVLFAKHGAQVTWHDVSRQYEQIARQHAAVHGVSLDFSLGYLEDAKKFARNSFDLVFCRVCWYYCRSDRAFGTLLFSLVKPGGTGYIECNTPAFSRPQGFRRLQHWLNAYFWWKVGHPTPPHGRIAKLIHNLPVTYMKLDYTSSEKDVVIFIKSTEVNKK
jgi:2-polyprenyl-3-methyl-5-hydroxy-6-metoxy-1,4-benzoquinol methylase